MFFSPLAICIGLRYTRAKRRNHFVSFIALASMLGIALGVMVLITVLSVMNGFDYQIKNRIFSVVSQVTVTSSTSISNWSHLAKDLTKHKDVVAAAPLVTGQGMLSNSGNVSGSYLFGVLPSEEKKVSTLESKMLSGSLNDLKEGSFNVILGMELAAVLGVGVGDKVMLMIPQASITPVGMLPRFKRCNVVGVFQVGGGFGFDSGAVFLNLHDAQKIFQMGSNVTSLRLEVSDLYAAPRVSEDLRHSLSGNYSVRDWTEEYGALFKAIQMEKNMMFIILLFIIAVATFNLVSTLVMAVTDKQADIAILRTLGASPKMIMTIFVVQGGIIGLIGTLVGVVSGIILALNATSAVNFLEHLFHVKFISSSIYIVDYLPSKLELFDVVRIGLTAFVLSLGATIYPAWRASRVNPAEALRYE